VAAALVLAAIAWSGCGGSPTAPSPSSPRPAVAVTCPAAVEVPSSGGAPVSVTYDVPVATGGAAPVTTTCTPPSGSIFPAGETTVTCTASDSTGQTATCGFGVTVTPRAQLSRTRIMAFGDSLTEGKVSLTTMLLVDAPAHAYTSKLQAKLRSQYAGQTISVINEGFGGELASASLNRFNGTLSLHAPEVVLLMHGVNDLNSVGTGVTQAAVDAVEELIKAGRNRGLPVLVATLPPLAPPKAGCPECVEPFNARLRLVAAAKGAVLVDVHAAWTNTAGGAAGLMGPDGIHPTEAGYEVIATAFFEAIRRTLEQPLP
jgi:lysophospholipase L1-like esterase